MTAHTADTANAPASTTIPAAYGPEPIDPAALPGWLGWSLGFFSEPVLQNPHVDMTLQLDITRAWACYQQQPLAHLPPPLSPPAPSPRPAPTQPPEADEAGGTGAERVSFFAFFVWHLAQTLARHPSFNLRCVGGQWYVLRNPPIFVPVAVGGDVRFRSLLLEDVYQQDLPTFLAQYRQQLALARSPGGTPPLAESAFGIAHFMGNLPQLRFSGLTLHWRADQSTGQSSFYVGQRYEEGEEGKEGKGGKGGKRMLMPLAVRLHHSCTDPLVLNELMADFNRRFE